jgi:hypothetical protein
MTPSPAPGPLDVADLRQRVQKALDGFLAGQLPQLDSISEELSPLTDALADLIAAASGCGRRSATGATAVRR